MSHTTTSTTPSVTAYYSHPVQEAAETVKDWAELVKIIKRHAELYPSSDRELQVARANKKLDDAKTEALRACDVWMNEIIKAAINYERLKDEQAITVERES